MVPIRGVELSSFRNLLIQPVISSIEQGTASSEERKIGRIEAGFFLKGYKENDLTLLSYEVVNPVSGRVEHSFKEEGLRFPILERKALYEMFMGVFEGVCANYDAAITGANILSLNCMNHFDQDGDGVLVGNFKVTVEREISSHGICGLSLSLSALPGRLESLDVLQDYFTVVEVQRETGYEVHLHPKQLSLPEKQYTIEKSMREAGLVLDKGGSLLLDGESVRSLGIFREILRRMGCAKEGLGAMTILLQSGIKELIDQGMAFHHKSVVFYTVPDSQDKQREKVYLLLNEKAKPEVRVTFRHHFKYGQGIKVKSFEVANGIFGPHRGLELSAVIPQAN